MEEQCYQCGHEYPVRFLKNGLYSECLYEPNEEDENEFIHGTTRYYATEPEFTSMCTHELKIKDRFDENEYFQITIEMGNLKKLKSKTQAILNALNSNK